ncbi:MAG: GNAT family N-acetyltransferase [Treponema sp.]|nr:GNAT family N-acetyltransferase [Treponema sp.]MCL2252609.1 GNAT family N-acetyltransferase [Treponema sp.]
MITITKAQLEDMEKILQLQYAAYQSEAMLHNDFTIQPLTQKLEEAIEEFKKCIVLKALFNNEIIGSVRAYQKEKTVYIGKLMVHPSHQGEGLGRKLLCAIENEFPNMRYELYTACKSERNLHLYETSGYTRFREDTDKAGIRFAYFEKL